MINRPTGRLRPMATVAARSRGYPVHEVLPGLRRWQPVGPAHEPRHGAAVCAVRECTHLALTAASPPVASRAAKRRRSFTGAPGQHEGSAGPVAHPSGLSPARGGGRGGATTLLLEEVIIVAGDDLRQKGKHEGAITLQVLKRDGWDGARRQLSPLQGSRWRRQRQSGGGDASSGLHPRQKGTGNEGGAVATFTRLQARCKGLTGGARPRRQLKQRRAARSSSAQWGMTNGTLSYGRGDGMLDALLQGRGGGSGWR
jgi:hypothetical protein